MCTVTYLRRTEAFILTMNRDERIDRAAELPPRVSKFSGQSGEAVWPVDPASGGTWIGANSSGLCACLLNGYQDSDAPVGAAKSRGLIIPDLMRFHSLEEVWRFVREDFEYPLFRSFTLILAQNGEAMTMRWTGTGRAFFDPPAAPPLFWTSSSWKAKEVLPWRENQYHEWLDGGAKAEAHGIPTIHLLQPDGLSEWSPLMKRSHSATRSITQILAGSTGPVTIKYWASPTAGCICDPEVVALRI